MYLTGFADEAAKDIEGQLRATKQLGWDCIEARNVDGVNIHDLPDKDFDRVYGKIQDAGIRINCFGSTIANWSKRINEPFDSSLQEAKRAIVRMKRLGTTLIRIMSFAVLPDRGSHDQMEETRFERLRQLTKMFLDEGLQPVHENCMNYGGMGWSFTLKLVEHVPGLKLVFDTGNPVFSDDRTQPEPYPKQSPWEFYSHVKQHVIYLHVKDAILPTMTPQQPEPKPRFCFPGEGNGDVKRIVKDLVDRNYEGGISIEPHMCVVYHDRSSGEAGEDARFSTYVEYGRRMEKLLREVQCH